eukprot:gnl/Spiro4/26978_TR13422_c0_g1_i1.p1 gnl/Spiro4/26978_TR13422_c0_g1~~gnl/Spiro4/26978_TR13422_c0_g1_i1.p1  ORF type:complete len:243 (-),score=76.49 gnl/Spiro4/26978_TR13422_c0_g1_i1:177-866(-)
MGISRDSLHKRRATGGKRKKYMKKRKYDLGRQGAFTKLSAQKRIHLVRGRGGNIKHRALRLETGTFSWGSESVSRKARILNVKYNASNNELVRTNTLVKGCIVQIDATPFRVFFETHYGIHLGKAKKAEETAAEKPAKPTAGAAKAASKAAPAAAPAKKSRSLLKKLESRSAQSKIDPALSQQFNSGRLLAAVSSRPGQSGRCDGYILEGEELVFYQHKLASKKKTKKA